MATKKFSGNTNYELDATATRSGKTITVTVKVTKTSGNGYWVDPPLPGYTVVIDGTTYSGTWDYDFRGSTPKTVSVTTRSKTNVTPGSRSWSVTVNMASGIGSASLSGSITVPYDAPSAPTIGTPVRVSDTRQTVHWTRNATVNGRYQSQQVQRRQYSTAGAWGAWVGVADIATDYTNSAAMSANDTTAANRIYQYRVKASNSTSEAYSAGSDQVYTTPGTPSALVASKTASGGIKLALTRTTGAGSYRHDIEYSINGGSSWSALTTLGSTTSEYTWNSPPAGETLVFRVRSRVENSNVIGHGLTSGWRQSNSVALAAPPNAPSSLSPNGAAFDAAAARTFTWRHNPVDSAVQTAYDLRHRPVGGAWTTIGKTTSATSSRVFPADTFTNGTVYEWQVRTWGVHADPSAWSNTATVTFSTPPVATITAPEGPLAASQVTMQWTYHDDEATTQSAWQAELVSDGNVIESRSGSGDTTETTFTTRLADVSEYTVRVRVRDGHNLWSPWDQVTFTTDFPLPTKPRGTASWDADTGAVTIVVENIAWQVSTVVTDTDGVYAFEYTTPEGDSDLFEDTDGIPAVVDGANDLALVLDVDGNPSVIQSGDAPDPNAVDTTSNDIIRSVDGGQTWETITTGAAVDAIFVDTTAPVGIDVMYRIIAWSDLPSSLESDIITVSTPADCGYWSTGEVMARIEYGHNGPPRFDFTQGLHEKTLHYFAGRTLPVETAGTSRARAGTVTFMSMTRDELATIRGLAYQPAPHLIRVPDGTTVYCSIGPVREARVAGEYFDITVDVTEVEQ